MLSWRPSGESPFRVPGFRRQVRAFPLRERIAGPGLNAAFEGIEGADHFFLGDKETVAASLARFAAPAKPW